MRVNLQEMVDLLSALAGKPFDVPTQQQLKTIFNYKRADWMQKVIEKYPDQRKYFLKDFSAELERVDKAECPVDTDCTVYRTVERIPIPIRTTYGLFDYVGRPDRFDAYTYIPPEQLYYIINYGSRYTPERPKYFYVNGYVYLYNEDSLDYLNIRGLWPDQRQLEPFKCDDVACYKDTDQYDIPDDILNTMVQDVLKNELKLLMDPNRIQVTLDNPDKQ